MNIIDSQALKRDFHRFFSLLGGLRQRKRCEIAEKTPKPSPSRGSSNVNGSFKANLLSIPVIRNSSAHAHFTVCLKDALIHADSRMENKLFGGPFHLLIENDSVITLLNCC